MNKTRLLLLLTFVLAGCGREQAPPAQTGARLQADASAGRAVAEARCMNCHGLDGRGTGPLIPHLAGQKLEYLQLALKEYRSGERPHAALQQLFSEVPEQDLANVAAFYASLPAIAPAGAQQTVDTGAVSAGKTAAAACAGCHGADGNATVPGNPSLAGQHRDYLIAAMQAYRDGSRQHAAMKSQVAGLDALTMQNLASFYAAQEPRPAARKIAGDPAEGERLSAACGSCHGLQGHTIDAATPALAGQDPHYLLAGMRAYRDGGRKHEDMRALLKPMNDEQLRHVAAFYASQTPRADQKSASLTAREWAERCDRCHAPTAHTPNLVVPRIDGQPRDYLAHVLRDYRDGKRHQSAMHAMGLPLTDRDIEAIAAYYAALPPR